MHHRSWAVFPCHGGGWAASTAWAPLGGPHPSVDEARNQSRGAGQVVALPKGQQILPDMFTWKRELYKFGVGGRG